MGDFAIVIEVDNKRAYAAYSKGLEDLQRIWPQVEMNAAKIDAKEEEQYMERISDWERNLCTRFGCFPYKMPSVLSEHKSIFDQLKHMKGIAGAAECPYRMTEHQVEDMIAWEDGSKIDDILSKIENMMVENQ